MPTMMRRDDIDALEQRRAKLVDDADRVSDLIDCFPSAEARRLLDCLVREIDRIDRVLAAARQSPSAA